LTILTKKDKLYEILKVYKSFGWEDVEQAEDKIYDDTLTVTLRRNHKIKNKDKLQLLQVHMESKLMELEKCQKYKFSKSISLGLTLGLGLVAVLVLGILLMATGFTVYAKFGGVILTIMSSILMVFLMTTLHKFVKEENVEFEKKSKIINKNIVDFCESAKKLLEVKNESK
jgi:hypothetical protein